MSAFKHFDVTRYLEDAKLESQARDPAKAAKAAKEGHKDGQALASLAALAGAQAESSNLEGTPKEAFGGPEAPTLPPTFNTEMQPKDAVDRPGLPKEWAGAAARLQQLDRPAHVTEDRWSQVLADADRLIDWVPMLEAMDWTPEDVFGRDDLDRKSLAWLVCGQRIGPITKIATTLRGADGSITWLYQRDSSDSADSPSPKANRPTPKTSRVGSAKSDKRWNPETTALIQWFLSTEPPSGPFRLQKAVYIARPDKYWEYLKGDIAAGPSRARGRTGALRDDLQRLYRIFHDGKDIGGGTT